MFSNAIHSRLFLRKIVASLFYYSGVSRIAAYRRKKGAVILAYHRVLPADDPQIQFIEPGMYVTTRTFEKHLIYFLKHYQIISLDRISADPELDKKCIITFDDGWQDNYKYAYPILKKYNVPATIFITTNLIGSKDWPWSDRLSYCIHNAPDDKLPGFYEELADLLGKNQKKLAKNITDLKNKYVIADYFISYFKSLEKDQLDSLIKICEKLMSSANLEISDQKPWLSGDEIKEMAQNNISFGSHTHSHLILTNYPPEVVRDELLKSQKILSKLIEKPVLSFSYPNGNYNKVVLDILKDLGFKFAVTTRSGIVRKSDNLLTLNRYTIHEDLTANIPMLSYRLNFKFYR